MTPRRHLPGSQNNPNEPILCPLWFLLFKFNCAVLWSDEATTFACKKTHQSQYIRNLAKLKIFCLFFISIFLEICLLVTVVQYG